MLDFILFRKLITPFLIQILFWLSIVFFVIVAVRDFSQHAWLTGVQVIVLGPLLARVVSEVLLLFFRIHDQLTQIKNTMQN